MLKSSLFIFVVSTIGISSFSTQAQEWKTLKENNYEIQYPANWQLNQSGAMSTSFLFLSPLSSAEDQFQENVNLLIQDLSAHNLDLDAYSKLSTGQIETMMPGGKLISSERLKKNGQEFQKVVYLGTQGDFNLKFEQFYWVINNKAYVLTLTCEANQFDVYKQTGEKILTSFHLN